MIPSPFEQRNGIGEVAGSVSMLVVTMALLAGAGAVSVLTVRGAASMITQGLDEEARSSGELIRVVSTQSNSTGSYIWLFNYGWEEAKISAVFLDGGGSGYTTSCPSLQQGFLCPIALPAGSHGIVTLVFGDASLAVDI